MIQRGDGFGFTLEPFAELRAGNFYRDVPIQTRIMGAIYFAHPAFTNRRKDLVRTEFVAEREGHRCYAILSHQATVPGTYTIAPESRRTGKLSDAFWARRRRCSD
jgi:hypothetical protein